jgi:hypothetical protein
LSESAGDERRRFTSPAGIFAVIPAMATLAIYLAVDRQGTFTRHEIFNSSNSHICTEKYLHRAQFRHKQLQFVVNTLAVFVENIASGHVFCLRV